MSSAPSEVEGALDAWAAMDEHRVVVPADRRFLTTARTSRALVLECAALGDERELFRACAVLGRLMANEGASPTFAARTLDALEGALGQRAPWLSDGRAALLEGYVAAGLERAQQDAKSLWEYPACAVSLGDDAVALAAGYPCDDEEALSGWAARVASGVVRDGFRRARVGGGAEATAALTYALDLAGVAIVRGERPSLSWLPWLRRGTKG